MCHLECWSARRSHQQISLARQEMRRRRRTTTMTKLRKNSLHEFNCALPDSQHDLYSHFSRHTSCGRAEEKGSLLDAFVECSRVAPFVPLFPRPFSERIVSFAHSLLISQLTSLLLRRFAQLSRSRYLLLLGLWSMLTADILIWMLTSF
jgi:hypothetical protein